MVTHSFDVIASLLNLAEPWSTVLRYYVVRLWHGIHAIARLEGSEKLVIGLACGRWQPVPDAAALAALADVVERSRDPKVIAAAASLLQHACVVQPLFRERMLELAAFIERLRSVDPGATGYALRSHLHFQGLLSGRLALADVDTDPDDLRRLWRRHVKEYRGHDPDHFADLLRVQRALQRASAELLLEERGLDMDVVHRRIAEIIVADLSAVRRWAERNLRKEDPRQLAGEVPPT